MNVLRLPCQIPQTLDFTDMSYAFPSPSPWRVSPLPWYGHRGSGSPPMVTFAPVSLAFLTEDVSCQRVTVSSSP